MTKEVKKQKPLNRKCKVCKERFKTFDFNRWWCCPECGVKLAKIIREKEREKAIAKRNREEKARIKAVKERLKSRSQWLSDAQKVFNKFIRLRDKNEPCISCGKHRNSYDAGHFKSVGSNPELRFNEDNCHKQCVYCNQHRHGAIDDYRIGLVKKIGLARVEFLDRKDHPPLKLGVPEIKELIKTYKVKVKELESAEV